MKVIPAQEANPICTKFGAGSRCGGFFLIITCFLCLLSSFVSRADELFDCSEESLIEAILSGEAIFTEDCEIILSQPLTNITDVIIDAQGHDVTISGGGSNLLFSIEGARFEAYGIKFVDGLNTNGNGGAFFIDAESSVLLSNCTLSGNAAVGTNGFNGSNGVNSASGNGGNGRNGTVGASAFGGAIFNLGSLTLLNCTLSDNFSAGGEGGSGGNGGNGAFNAGGGGNGAKGGSASSGAIYHEGDELVLSNCTFSANTVFGGPGGFGGTSGSGSFPGLPGSGAAGGSASGAAVFSTSTNEEPVVPIIVNCTFSDNSAEGGNSAAGGTEVNGNGKTGPKGADSFGGGVYAMGAFITNCTFYSNNVTGGAGGDGGNGTHNAGNGGNGGIATGGGFYSLADSVVVSCTFSNCNAFGGTNGVAGSGAFPGQNGTKGASRGGDIANAGGAFHLANTILATNQSGGAAYGSIADGGYNIGFGSTITFTESTSFKTNNAGLGPLADNGGPTKTMAPLTNSPALNQIPVDVDFPETDQRGFPRPMNFNAEIGAVETTNAGPVTIIQQPTNAVAKLNSNAVFRVLVAGTLPFKYQWQLNGTNLLNATSSTYTLTNATPEKAGPYSVIISNFVQSNSYFATSVVAFVKFLPSITNQPLNQTIEPGRNAFFSVGATGEPPLTYQWRFEEEEILNATNSSLTISNAQSIVTGEYAVVVANDYGSVTSAPAVLNLIAAIVTQPASQTVNLGGTVTFTVNAAGSPPLIYQWRRVGSNTIAGATSSAYTISGVRAADAGPYEVVVTNQFNSVTSAPAILTVQGVQFPISNPKLSSNQFSFTFSTSPGSTYVTEYRTNVSSGPWLPLVTNVGNGNPITITNSTTNFPASFFRVRLQ